MNAGQLRHRVAVERPVRRRNELGEIEISWTQVCMIWADIHPKTAREANQFAHINSQISHTVIMRYSPEIQMDRRLVFNGRHFDIVGIVNVQERNRELQVLCSEGAN